MRTRYWLLALWLSFALSGCTATHLAYVHNSSLGVDVAFSTEGTQRVSIGYDSDTFALVPVVELDQSTRDARAQTVGGQTVLPAATEAMSLAAVSYVRVDGLSEVRFDHFISTGRAANAIAKDEEGLKLIRRAIFSESQ